MLAVSRPLRDTLLKAGVPASSLHLVPNGFAPGPTLDRDEARLRLGLDATSPTLGWIGRFTKEKDPAAFVDLVAQLDIAGLQAVMVGDGPEQERARERMVAHGLDGNTLRMPGRIDGAAAYLRAFDALVLTSRTEGTPMVLLEAMAAGTPIATYDVGGIKDFLDPVTACVVPAGERSRLAAGIREMFADPILTEQRVARARTLLYQRFAAGAWLDGIEKIYDSVLGGS